MRHRTPGLNNPDNRNSGLETPIQRLTKKNNGTFVCHIDDDESEWCSNEKLCTLLSLARFPELVNYLIVSNRYLLAYPRRNNILLQRMDVTFLAIDPPNDRRRVLSRTTRIMADGDRRERDRQNTCENMLARASLPTASFPRPCHLTL